MPFGFLYPSRCGLASDAPVELELSVHDPAVLARHPHSLTKAKRARQPVDRGSAVLVVEIGADPGIPLGWVLCHRPLLLLLAGSMHARREFGSLREPP